MNPRIYKIKTRYDYSGLGFTAFFGSIMSVFFIHNYFTKAYDAEFIKIFAVITVFATLLIALTSIKPLIREIIISGKSFALRYWWGTKVFNFDEYSVSLNTSYTFSFDKRIIIQGENFYKAIDIQELLEDEDLKNIDRLLKR